MADQYRGRSRGYNDRKRRYREEDDYDRRPQRRRYEEPLVAKVRKQLLSIAESPLKKTEDEVASIAKTVAENYFDDELQNEFYDLLLQLVLEQPLKIPFVAAIVLVANTQKPEVTTEILNRSSAAAQRHIEAGSWKEFKLLLRFLALLQGLFEGEGIFPILEDLFYRAADLQTASSEDALGLEMVKVILLTIPYVLASSATGLDEQVLALLDKTDIITSTPHPLEPLVNPYPVEEKAQECQNIIGLLQKQLQREQSQEWAIKCIPRPWKMPPDENGADPLALAQKHAFPSINIPSPVTQGSKPMFPEPFLSVYADQEVETVPPMTDISSSVIRDVLVDVINVLDFNRNATAKFLTDIDCYFSPDTFVKRATPFDKLKAAVGNGPTWKPEDVAVDAVFSQLFQLPTPEHKLVYYHSVLTELCKIAPAAVAPSLGRAIRFLYRNIDVMDLELGYRFMDWFAHHLSNFGFTWKWTEWVDDVGLPDVHPKKAFIIGALDKEIRLSFAQRIRGTLPEPYQVLIPPAKEKDTPDFKYNSDDIPYAEEARLILTLIRKKAKEEEVQAVIDTLHAKASEQGVSDVLIPSTDAYVTSICYIGSKSLSHVLSCIERCKDRLLTIGRTSAAARKQIISSVMDYWRDQPGIGVNIIDKLLNYTILTPMSVIEWVLVDRSDDGDGGGRVLAQSHMYEMTASTVCKVTNRVRQIVAARDQAGLPREQVDMLDETVRRERAEQADMFRVIEKALLGFAQGGGDDETMQEGSRDGGDEQVLIRDWAERWLRVFRRMLAVQETVVGEGNATGAAAAAAAAIVEGERDGATENGEGQQQT